MNFAVTRRSISPTAPAPRKPLALVYAVMAFLAFAIAAALELGGMRSPDIADAGAFPFILTVVTGALGAWVASFGHGAAGGALTGFAYALGGGIVHLFAPGSAAPVPPAVATLLLITVLGSALGALGALPVAFVRWRRGKGR